MKFKNPLKRTLIKDYINIDSMGKSNNNNPATPDGQTESDNGAQRGTTIVSVDAEGNPINEQQQPQAEPQVQPDPRTGNLPNQPPGGNTDAIGGPGENNNQDNLQKAREEANNTDQAPNQQPGLDLDKLITKSTKEVRTADAAQKERVEKQKRLMTALNSRGYMEEVIYKNEETNQELGRKLRYVKDPKGKTIYDYMNDPEVQDHIGFIVDDDDPRDGSFIKKQISFYWINPIF